MGETVKCIKDLLHPFLANHQLVLACEGVTEDCAVFELNVLEAKADDGCFAGSDFFQGGLIESQLAIVNGWEGDGKDVRRREPIGDHIVFSTDVTHVGEKLADERQVASLTRRMLGSTGEGEGERLMISEHGELVALNVVAKVFYCEEGGQQLTINRVVLLLSIGKLSRKEGHRVPDTIEKRSKASTKMLLAPGPIHIFTFVSYAPALVFSKCL